MKHVLALGEILWDLFEGTTLLGGAPLNFTAHASRMGHKAILVSAVGDDELGRAARVAMETLCLDTRFVQTTAPFPTGTASVIHGLEGQVSFRIKRPAAYDAVQLSEQQLRVLVEWAPAWLYYGTLFSCGKCQRETLHQLARALPSAIRFYDVNLRPGCYSAGLVTELLELAQVVKLNESEMAVVAEFADLPSSDPRAFCRQGSARYGWRAACVTMGARGCGVWRAGEYEEAPGYPVKIADTVGAGDGVAAALLHGLAQQWRPGEIATFANRVGAIIASRPGGMPQWHLSEAMTGV